MKGDVTFELRRTKRSRWLEALYKNTHDVLTMYLIKCYFGGRSELFFLFFFFFARTLTISLTAGGVAHRTITEMNSNVFSFLKHDDWRLKQETETNIYI